MPLKKQNKTLAEQEAVSHEKPAAKCIAYSHQWMDVKAMQKPKFLFVCVSVYLFLHFVDEKYPLGKQLE